MFAAGMATFVLLYDVQALLPELVRAYAVSPARATLALSLTTAALALTLLVAGPVSEVVGRTRLIHLALWSSAVVAPACAVAPTWETLLGLRMLQGVTLAGLPAVATAYLREELHPSAHGRAFGLYIGGTALGRHGGPLGDRAGRRSRGVAVGARRGRRLRARQRRARRLAAARVAVTSRPVRRAHGMPSARPGRRSSTTAPCIALYVLGACAVGALVAVLNALGFRLTTAPYDLSVGTISLVYLVYALGSVSSACLGTRGRPDREEGHHAAGRAIALAGVLLTLSGSLPFVILGVAALTVGFFCVHGLASGWVTARAHLAGVSTGQAAAFYLFAYYVGSSVFGTLGSAAWSHAGWPGVVAVASVAAAHGVRDGGRAAAYAGAGGPRAPPADRSAARRHQAPGNRAEPAITTARRRAATAVAISSACPR